MYDAMGKRLKRYFTILLAVVLTFNSTGMTSLAQGLRGSRTVTSAGDRGIKNTVSGIGNSGKSVATESDSTDPSLETGNASGTEDLGGSQDTAVGNEDDTKEEEVHSGPVEIAGLDFTVEDTEKGVNSQKVSIGAALEEVDLPKKLLAHLATPSSAERYVEVRLSTPSNAMEIPVDHWKIVLPDENAEFNTKSKIEIQTYADGTIKEVKTGEPEVPSYKFIPVFDLPSGYDYAESMFENYLGIEEYLTEEVGITVEVEAAEMLTLNRVGTVEIAINDLVNDADNEDYTYSKSEKSLTLKKSGSYRLYRSGSSTNVGDIGVKFAEGADTVVLSLDSVPVSSYNLDEVSAIDLTNVQSAQIIFAGEVPVTGGYKAAGIHVPADTSLEITGDGDSSSKLTLRATEDGIALGSMSGSTGDITIAGGTVVVEAKENKTVGVGAYDASSGGSFTVSAGDVTVDGGYSRGDVHLYPIQGVALDIAPYSSAAKFVVLSKAQSYNQDLEMEGFLLRGMLDESLKTDATLTISKGEEFENTISLPVNYKAFMMSVPAAGNYRIGGSDIYERKYVYMGQNSSGGDSDYITDFAVTENGDNVYINLTQVFQPVFWKDSAVIDGEYVELTGSVDKEDIESEIGKNIYNTGNQDILDKGFVIFIKNAEGKKEFWKYYNEHGQAAVAGETRDPGAGEIKVKLDGVLEPGKTYYVNPYALTKVGRTIAYEYNVSNDSKADAEIEIIMPKINFPTKLEFTYGTFTRDALDNQTFQDLEGAVDNHVTVDGVAITFDSTLPADEYWGSNIPGRFRLNKEGGDGWSLWTVDAGTHDDFLIEFIPEKSGQNGQNEQNEQYKILSADIQVKVNPRTLVVDDIENKEKVYDGTTDALVGSVILAGVITPQADNQRPEDDVHVDIGADGFTAVYDTKDAGDEKTVTLTNLSLVGSRAFNYTLSAEDAASKTISGNSITKRPISIGPKAYTKKVGEKWNGGNPLEAELLQDSTLGQGDDLITIAGITNEKFDGVPAITDGEGDYTVSLKDITSNNYEIDYSSNAIYTVTQDDAKLGKNFGINGTLGDNGWYRSDVTIQTSENEDGYDQIQVYTNESNQIYATQVSVTENGENSLRVRLKNSSTGAYTKRSGKQNIKIDKEYPSVDESTITFTDTSDNPESIKDKIFSTLFGNFYKAPVRVNMTVNDNVSGVADLYYSLDGGSTEKAPIPIEAADGGKEGTVSFDIPQKQMGNVTFRVTDKAGNSTKYEVKVNGTNYWIIEDTLPQVEVTTQGVSSNANTQPVQGTDGQMWYNEGIKLYASVTDPGDSADTDLYSGIRKIMITVGESEETFTDPAFTEAKQNQYSGVVKSFTGDAKDAFQVTVDVMDNAGNTAENPVSISDIKIDATAPELSDPIPSTTADTKDNVTVSFHAVDTASGLYSLTWKLGEDETPLVLSEEGSYSFDAEQNGVYTITAADHVGHNTEKTITISNIDKKAPEITEITAPEGAADGWYQADSLDFKVTAADEEQVNPDYKASGIVKLDYTVTYQDDPGKTYTGTLTGDALTEGIINISKSGTFTITAKVTDNAGNTSADFKTGEYKLDNQTPVLKVTPSVNVAGTDQWTKDSVSLLLENTTAAQVAGTEFYVEENSSGTWQKLSDYVSGKSGYNWTLAGETARQGTLSINANLNADLAFKAVTGSGKETAASQIFYVRVTVGMPQVKDAAIAPSDQGTNWYAGENAPVVTISASEQVVTGDRGSAPVTTHYEYQRTDNGSAAVTGTPFNSGTKVLDFKNDTAAGDNTVILPNGIYTVKIWATDAAGHETAKTTYTFKVDDEAPAADTETITYEYRNTNNSWIEAAIHKLSFGYFFNKEIRVTVPVSDNVSGNDRLHYTLKASGGDDTAPLDKSAEIQDGKAIFTIPMDTEGYIRYYASDQAGNHADTLVLGTDGAKIWITEAEAPVIPALSYTMADAGGKTVTVDGTTWHTEPVTVSATVTDNPQSNTKPYAGLASVTYKFGEHDEVTESDLKTEAGERLAEKEISRIIRAEGRSIAMTASAADNAGNVSETLTETTLNTDLNAPVIGTVELETPADQFTNQDYEVSFTVEDAMSGVDSVTVNGTAADRADVGNTYSTVVSVNGTYTITATDKTGHESTKEVIVGNLDKLNPVISEITAEGSKLESGIYNDTVRLTVTGDDAAATDDYAKSGIGSYYVYNTVNGTGETLLASGTWSGTSIVYDLIQSGNYKIKVKVVDKAGNSFEKLLDELIVINNANPDLSVDFNAMDITEEDVSGEGRWLSEAEVLFKLSSAVFAGGQTVMSVSSDDGVNWEDLKENGTPVNTFYANVQGTNNYKFKNTHTTSSKYVIIGPYKVKLDNQNPAAPTYSVDGTAMPDQSAWYYGSSQPEVAVIPPEKEDGEGTDSSPVHTWFQFWKEGTQEPEAKELTGSVKPSIPDGTANDGTWNLKIWSKDEAGNVSYGEGEAPTYKIQTDTSAPAIGTDITVEPETEGGIINIFKFGNYFNDVLKVSVTVTDTTSKVQKLDYAISDVDGAEKTGTAATEGADVYTFTVPVGTTASEITLTAYDYAGNTTNGAVKSDKSNRWTVETDNPAVSWSYNSAGASGDWYHEPVSVKATVSDEVSGLNLVEWKREGDDSFTNVYTQSADGDTKQAVQNVDITLGAAGQYTDNGAAQKVIIYARDNSGNGTAYESTPLKIDTVAPVVSVTPFDQSAWVSEPRRIDFTVTDEKDGIETSKVKRDTIQVWKTAGSGEPVLIDSKYFHITESEAVTGQYTCWFKADENGTYVIKAEDVAGNAIESDPITVEKVDLTTPTVPVFEVKAGETPVTSGTWVTQTPVITVTKPMDTTVSVSSVNYKLWKGGTEPAEKTGTVDFAGQPTADIRILEGAGNDGIWHFKVWSENEAGTMNPALPDIFTVKVDRQIPAITLNDISFKRVNTGALADIGRFLTFGNFFKEAVEVVIPMTDDQNGSGLKSLHYISGEDQTALAAAAEMTEYAKSVNFIITDGMLNDAGEIVIYAEDYAGNLSSQSTKLTGEGDSSKWVIETEGPVIDPLTLKVKGSVDSPTSVTDLQDGTTQWYTKELDITTTVKDAGSGINHADRVLIKDGVETEKVLVSADNPQQPGVDYSYSETLPDGRYSVEITAEDNATNPALPLKQTINIDTTAPVIDPDYDATDAWAQEQKVGFTLSDRLSGVYADSLEVKKDGAASITPDFSNGAYSFTATENGTYTINVKDRAGNEAAEISITFAKIDRTAPAAPAVTLEPSAPNGNDPWYKKGTTDPKFTLTPSSTDAGTAPVTTYYKIWNGDAEPEEAQTLTSEVGAKNLSLTSSGTWHIKVWASDAAGNETGSSDDPSYEKTVQYDKISPVMEAPDFTDVNGSPIAELLNKLSFGTFFNKAVKVNITVTDEGTSGNQNLYYRTTNSEAELEDTVTADDYTQVTITGGKASFTIPDEFDGYIQYYADDKAGNISELKTLEGESGVYRYVIDGKKPSVGGVTVTDSSESPTEFEPNANGWYKQNVWLKAEVADAAVSSGLASVTWNANGTDTGLLGTVSSVIPTYSVNKEISAEGTSVIRLNAEDNAGNSAYSAGETTPEKTVKIDKTVPQITVTKGDSDVPVNADINVEIEIKDAVSGIDLEALVIMNTTENKQLTESDYTAEALPDGSGYKIKYTVTENADFTIDVQDLAGNAAVQGSLSITNIDKTGLKLAKVTVNGENASGEAWYRDAEVPVIAITNPETAEGAAYNTYYKLVNPGDIFDKENKEGYTKLESGSASPALLNQDGVHTLYVYTTKLVTPPEDSAIQTYLIKVDRVLPVITDPTGLPGAWVKEEQSISFQVTDTEVGVASGIDTVEVRKDGVAAPVALTSDSIEGGFRYDFTTVGNGSYTITARDVAGNISARTFTVANIDTAIPGAIDVVVTGADGDNGWYKTVPTVTVTPAAPETAEGQSEISTYYYAWTGEDNITDVTDLSGTKYPGAAAGTIANPFTTDGKWHLIVWSKDAAGNVCDEPKKIHVNLDQTDPEVSDVSRTPDGSTTGSVTVTFTVEDITSLLMRADIAVTDEKGAAVAVTYSPNTDNQGSLSGSFITDKNHTYQITVKDKAGNSISQQLIVVDNIATEGSIPSPGITVDELSVKTGWYNETEGAVLKIFKQANPTDSIKYKTIYTLTDPDGIAVGGENAEIGEDADIAKPVTVTLTDGTWTLTAVTARNTDYENDRSTVVTKTIKVDKTKPEIAYADGNPSQWTKDSAIIRFSVEDITSQITDIDENEIKVMRSPGAGETEASAYEVTKDTQNPDTYLFTADQNGVYTLSAKDNAGNTASEVKVTVTRIDKQEAGIAAVTVVPDAPDGNDPWYVTKPTVTITEPEKHVNDGSPNGAVTDEAPITTWYTLKYKAQESVSNWTPLKENYDFTTLQEQPSQSMDRDGIYELTVWTETAAGMESSKNQKTFYVDSTKPQAASVVSRKVNEGSVAKVINFLTFGNFFNEAIRVTVTSDEAQEATSGPMKLHYLVDQDPDAFNAGIKTVDFTGRTAVFDIEPEITASYLKFKVEDTAGNQSDLYKAGEDQSLDSILWTLDTGNLMIENFAKTEKSGTDSANNPWNNSDVTLSSDVVNTVSGLEQVDGVYTGAKDGTVNAYTRPNASEKKEKVEFSQTIEAEGTTTFNIYAKDNALNEKHLSDLSEFASGETRTVRIDRKLPVVTEGAGNPTDWTSNEVEIFFSVTDEKTADAVKGTDYSAVNPTVGEDAPATSIKVMKDSTDYIKAELVSYDSATDTYTFKFTTQGNGSYMVSAKDYAANEGQLSEAILVTKIGTGDGPKAPVDGTAAGSETQYGYVDYPAIDGENGFYKTVPAVTVTNSTDFVVNSGTLNTTPVNTYYKLWNSTVQDEPGDSEAVKVGYTTVEGEVAPVPEEAGLQQTIAEADDPNGLWMLEIWNKNDIGDKSEVKTWKFDIDITKPVISEIKATPSDADVWYQAQEVSFKVSDNYSKVNDGSIIVKLGETVLTPVLKNGTADTWCFTATERGIYTFDVKDMAGNPAAQQNITLDHVSTDIPDNADVTIPEANENGWYTSYPAFTLKGPVPADGAAPITTYYQLWQGDGPEPDITEAKTLELTANMELQIRCNKEGQWNLHVWTLSASGVRSEAGTDYRKTVFVDTVKPKVNPVPLEFKEINTEGWAKFINKLSFGLFYNEAIQVTVEVTDATSHPKTLDYAIERQDGSLLNGSRPVTPDASDETRGTAVFELPIGTRGSISMISWDSAGNQGDPEMLGYEAEDGSMATWWEIENIQPKVTMTVPVNNATDVSVSQKTIELTFDEQVTPVSGKHVEMVYGGVRYQANADAAVMEDIADAAEDAHNACKAVFKISDFMKDGKALELESGGLYVVYVESGAFKDWATNGNLAANAGIFTTLSLDPADAPKLTGMNENLPEGMVLTPDFNQDTLNYVLSMLDSVMNSDGSGLKEDLVLEFQVTKGASVSPVLTNVPGSSLLPLDCTITPGESSDTVKITVPKDSVKKNSSYFIKIPVKKHGQETIYSIFVNSSAVAAIIENAGESNIRVDLKELLEALRAEIEQYTQLGHKVSIIFRAAQIREEAAAKALEAIMASTASSGISDPSVGYYMYDFSVQEVVSNNVIKYLTELEKPIDITIPVPEKVKGRALYGVFRYHDGKAELLAPKKWGYRQEDTGSIVYLDQEDKSNRKNLAEIVISSDKFSIYALAYDTVGSGTSDSGSSGGSGGSGGVIRIGSEIAYYGGVWYNTGYLFTKSDGTRPSNEWLRIDGRLYYFTENGFRAGYRGYTQASDGSLTGPEPTDVETAAGTWLNDGWWYQLVDGSWLTNGWYYLFYNGKFDWYYFDKDGWMMDGWMTENGKTYYLHTVHDTTRGHMYSGWQFIDGKWYYFRKKGDGNEGVLLKNALTSDGHYVGADGVWDGRGTTPVKGE